MSHLPTEGGFQLPLRHAEQLFTMKNIQDQKMQIMESQPRLLIVFNDITSLISVRVCLKEKHIHPSLTLTLNVKSELTLRGLIYTFSLPLLQTFQLPASFCFPFLIEYLLLSSFIHFISTKDIKM